MFVVFDALLAVITLLVAVMLVRSASLLHASILFIVFGVLVALVWLRLNAPDAALAEAAIGAGLTGALLLATIAQLTPRSPEIGVSLKSELMRPAVMLLGLATLLMAVAFSWLVPALFGSAPAPALTDTALTQLDQSGVSHPVTAVLLSYRAWDTLLELAVLLLALIGARAVAVPGQMLPEPVAGPVLATATRIITPVMMMVGLYLLWLGSHAPGGAFQSGAVLAASLVLYWLAFPQAVQALPKPAVEALVVLGLTVFIAAGLLVSLSGWAFLQWPDDLAYGVILFVEIAATLSIAMTLALLFAGNLKTSAAGRS